MSKEIANKEEHQTAIEAFLNRQKIAIDTAIELIDDASLEKSFGFTATTIPFSNNEIIDGEFSKIINAIMNPFLDFGSAYHSESHAVMSITNLPDLIVSATVNEETVIVSIKRLKTYEHESGLEIDHASFKVKYLSDELVSVPLSILKELSFLQNKESFCLSIKEVEHKQERFDFKSEAIIIETEDFHDLIYRYKMFKGI